MSLGFNIQNYLKGTYYAELRFCMFSYPILVSSASKTSQALKKNTQLDFGNKFNVYWCLKNLSQKPSACNVTNNGGPISNFRMLNYQVKCLLNHI